MTVRELRLLAAGLRLDILDIVYRAKSGHIGGDLSAIDILTALYFHHMRVSPGNAADPDRDRCLLSKGHSVEALYAVLAAKGFFPRADLETVSQFGSPYIGHPTKKIPGIEMCTGSLGHGLSLGAGMALALKKDSRLSRVFVVLGDGELAEGSNWEGAMAAGQWKLDNLYAFIDRNRLQISGSTEAVMTAEPLAQRFESFGWRTKTIGGNDMGALVGALDFHGDICMPAAIICETTKGAGVSFMENSVAWHHRVPTAEEYEEARCELSEKKAAI